MQHTGVARLCVCTSAHHSLIALKQFAAHKSIAERLTQLLEPTTLHVEVTKRPLQRVEELDGAATRICDDCARPVSTPISIKSL